MLATGIKLIFRNWKRNKLFSFTAIVSLTIGFTCCNLLAAFVINEWKISNGSSDNERIFALKTDNPMTLETTREKSSWIIKQLPPLLKKRYPEVESFCRFKDVRGVAVFNNNVIKTDVQNFLQADCNINEYFNIPVIVGDLNKTLSSPGEVAITASWAKKIFGNGDVLGKSFTFKGEGENTIQKITAVIDDSYSASFITFNVLFPFNEKEFWGGVTFLKLRNGDSAESLIQKIDNDLDELPKLTNDCKYYLQSMHEFYFDKSETQSNWQFLLKRDSLFVTVGIFAALAILFVGCFNFINLYLVRVFKSTTSKSIQLLLGSSNLHLQKQFLLESFITTLLSFCLSFAFVVILLPSFNKIFAAHLTYTFLFNKSVLLFYFMLITMLTIIPVVFIGVKFKNSALVNLQNANSGRSKTVFSNVMMSLQFGFSVVLIIAAISYIRQLNFITDTANINPDIIEIEAEGISGKGLETFKSKVNQLSCINASTLSNTSFLNAWIALGNDNVPTLGYNMDNDFSKVHNIELVEGAGFFSNNNSNSNQAIVNQTFVKKFNLQSPVGQNVEVAGKEIHIVGVVRDFYTESFCNKIKPTVIKPFASDDNFFKTIQIRIQEDIPHQLALHDIESLWRDHFPDKEFSYRYLADDFESLHKDYRKLSEMISFFSIISLLLTGFGLFALAWYSVENKTKEIGIRKVNGAKNSEVLIMLNKDFVKWVAIAFVIATPIAYYAMNKWLENFAYKTELSWWIFALAGVLALGIALLTVSWQSWKAATRNPVEALRYE